MKEIDSVSSGDIRLRTLFYVHFKLDFVANGVKTSARKM